MNISEKNAESLKRIDANKSLVKAAISTYIELAKGMRNSYRDFQAKLDKYKKKQTDKNASSVSDAKAKFDESLSHVKQAYTRLYNLLSSIETDWSSVVESMKLDNQKIGAKEAQNMTKYLNEVNKRKAEGDKIVNEAGIHVSDLVDASATISQAKNANGSKQAIGDNTTAEDSAGTAQQSKSVAQQNQKLSIDPTALKVFVNTSIEMAVNAAVEKISASIEEKITECLKNIDPTALSTSPQQANISEKESAELQAKIADDGNSLLEKLTSLVETINELNNSIVGALTSFTTIDAKFNEIAELQNQVNDMQRRTMREQQGVQVNQRIISKDQLAIADEQTSIMNLQKANLEEQKRISSEQTTMATAQKAIIDAQASISETINAATTKQEKTKSNKSSSKSTNGATKVKTDSNSGSDETTSEAKA